jgi:hypothetical protein
VFHSTNPSFFGRPASVLSESRQLRLSVLELRRVCVSLMGRMPRAFVDADAGLSDLFRRLSVYFDIAENDAHFQAIAEECPSLRDRASAIGKEHEDLKHSVSSLRDLASRANATRLAKHIGSVLDRLEQHEIAETELLQDFFRRSGEGEVISEVTP